MSVTAWWQIAAGGMCGPIVIELAKMATWHNMRRCIVHWRNPLYWLSFGAFVLLGGLLATLMLYGDGSSVPVLRAVHIGATAPLLVSAWASAQTNDARPRSRQSGRMVPGTDAAGVGEDDSVWNSFIQAVRW